LEFLHSRAAIFQTPIEAFEASNAEYKLVSDQTFAGDRLNAVYNKVLEAVKPILQQSKSGYHVTTDGWTSKANEPYISYTVHFIDDQWQLRSFVLAARKFPHPHTGVQICSMLDSLRREFNLSEDAWKYSVVDGGRNYQLAIRLGPSVVLYCAAHRLNVKINKSLKDSHAELIIAELRKLISAFKNSTKSTQELQKRAKEKGLPYLKLKLSCPTRWNSTYEMIRRFNAMEELISSILKDPTCDIEVPSYPSLTQLKEIQEFEKILAPLNELTTALCADKYPSLGKEIVLWLKARSSISGQNLNLAQEIAKNLRTRLHEKLDIKIPDVQKEAKNLNITASQFASENRTITALIATFLNPKYRDALKRTLDDVEYVKFMNGLNTVYRSFVKNIQEADARNSTNQPAPVPDSPETKSPDKKKSKTQDTMNFEDVLFEGGDTSDDQPLAQLKVYGSLLFSSEERKEMDALEWWKSNQKTYNYLAPLARIYLAIPATSTTSERVWSKSGRVASESRSRLGSSKVEKIVFIDFNSEVLVPTNKSDEVQYTADEGGLGSFAPPKF
jgi:hypothetical protein